MFGVSDITHEDKEQLETIGTFQHKRSQRQEEEGYYRTQSALRPTKPPKFHFAIHPRVWKHQVEDPATAPTPSIFHHTHSDPIRSREVSFATDAQLKVKKHIKGEKAEAPVDFSGCYTPAL